MLYDRRRDLSLLGRDLLAAADYIREHGWCQRRGHDDGRVCIFGALIAAGRWPSATIRTDEIVAIAAWNDKVGRTADEVIDRLETAAWEPDVTIKKAFPAPWRRGE